MKEMKKNIRLRLFYGCCLSYFHAFFVYLSLLTSLCFLQPDALICSLGNEWFLSFCTADTHSMIWDPTLWLKKRVL